MAIAAPRGKRRFEEDDEEFYITSDGKPMAETQKHADQMIYCIKTLEVRYANRPDVYVWGNNFIHYQQGARNRYVAPDCYVVFGVEKRERDNYKVWEEGGRTPDVVFEITSRSTQREDTHKKRPLYETILRVPEYYLFDPTGDYLKPRLQGFRLREGRYEPMRLADDRLHSDRLGLDLVMQGETLRFYDSATGDYLRTPEEEAHDRAAAEAENARLRAELDRLRQKAND
jgi:Uma2 family endonuclease